SGGDALSVSGFSGIALGLPGESPPAPRGAEIVVLTAVLAAESGGGVEVHAADRVGNSGLFAAWCRLLHARFRIQKEVARCDDPLSGPETSDDFDAASKTPAGLNLAR